MSTDLNKFKRLSEVEHVLTRPGMYVGSIENTDIKTWVYTDSVEEKEILYNPGLMKFFDEIITNSADHYVRTGDLTKIDVNISTLTGEIRVSDDGGIPVEKHPEYSVYIPELIFGELRAGENFEDSDRATGGMNGLGSKLTNIFSTSFEVRTADTKNVFIQKFSNNMSKRTSPTVTKSSDKGTVIKFVPDYDRLGITLSTDLFNKLKYRTACIAACIPGVKVTFNGEVLSCKSFKDHVAKYVDTFQGEETAYFKVYVSSSNDSFKHISFVNNIDTYNGGTHVDYISSAIITKLRETIKKKHKVDVKPAIIKQHMFLFLNCNINAPTFTSQTKEYMDLPSNKFGRAYTPSDKFIKQLLSSDVVAKILQWVENEKRRKELAQLKKLNKDSDDKNALRKIVKFEDASSKDRSVCSLFITEGDSAKNTVVSARDPKTVGVYPLRGKLLNVKDIDVKRLAAKDEIRDLISIIGLKFGKEVKSLNELRFPKIYIATDMDVDGQHIRGLFFNFINEFWPELFTLGAIHILRTPLIVATKGKTKVEFFDENSYTKWAEKNKSHKMKYYKGLGGFVTKDFKQFLSNIEDYTDKVKELTAEDKEMIDVAFSKYRAEDRKEWLA